MGGFVNSGLARGILRNALGAAGGYAGGVQGLAGDLSGLAGSIPVTGYTPQQQSSILNAVLGAINNQYNTTRQRAQDVAGRTGAYASLLPMLTDIGNRQASALSGAGGKLTQQFAEFPTEQKRAAAGIYTDALRGLLGLFGPEMGFAGRTVQGAIMPSLLSRILAGAGGGALGDILGPLASGAGKALGNILFGGGGSAGGASDYPYNPVGGILDSGLGLPQPNFTPTF